MPPLDVEPLEAVIDIAASPARVWALVSDPRTMRRWSPQTALTLLRSPVREGTWMVNLNRRGLLVWPTRARVLRFDPEREIAWRVAENFTIWSYRLEAVPGGTRLTARRETPDGISALSSRLTERALGGSEAFTAELARDLRRTVEAIKADAEQ